jgi:elongation factor Ts
MTMSTEIPAKLVKALRDATGAGMMECKAALQEANGDLEEATLILRKRGLAQAAKKSGRATSEGLIGSYIHAGRQDRRTRRAQLRVGLRGTHR